MSSLILIPKGNSSDTNEIKDTLQLKINKTKKCPIKKSIGLITPKDEDNFISFIKNNENENNQNNNNIIRINIVNDSKISWSKNPFFKNDLLENKENSEPNMLDFQTTQEFIRTINKDSIESYIPCKPMLNSTASKTFMQEYSKSKKFQEDLNSLPDSGSLLSYQKENKIQNSLDNNIIEEENSMTSFNSIFDDIDDLIKYQEEHLPVPISKKDNENFKILTMKKMKRKSIPPNKSVRKFEEDREPKYEKEFRINNDFCKLLKRKAVHSSRRIYSSNFILGDGKNQKEFKIFRDKDIGIYEYWQTHIHENNNDEDVETDEEQKTLAKCFTLGEIKEAFTIIKKRNYKETFVNFIRYDKFRSQKENEKIENELWNLRFNIFL